MDSAGATEPIDAFRERARRLERYRRAHPSPGAATHRDAPESVRTGADPARPAALGQAAAFGTGGTTAPRLGGATASTGRSRVPTAATRAADWARATPSEAGHGRAIDARLLAQAIGGEVQHSPAGRLVRVRTSMRLPLDVERLARLPFPIDPRAPLCCLDTETTGLATASGTFAFMIGLGCWEGERFTVEQLVLPDQPDEPALLDALRHAIPSGAWLVTYNGRTFDWPLIEARYRLRRDAVPDVAGHLDLLQVARRLWRHRLPDARLATVEAAVAGVRRDHDLPGALVPARYLAYLRTGRPEGMRSVAEHNRDDIVSLARLLTHLAGEPGDPRGQHAHPGDAAALARAYARRGRFDEAVACVDDALRWHTDGDATEADGARALLAVERARLLRRAGRSAEASRAWHELAAAGGPAGPQAWVEIAKEREHRFRDPAGALAAAEHAARLVERARLRGIAHPSLERDLLRRRYRLRQRLKRPAA